MTAKTLRVFKGDTILVPYSASAEVSPVFEVYDSTGALALPSTGTHAPVYDSANMRFRATMANSEGDLPAGNYVWRVRTLDDHVVRTERAGTVMVVDPTKISELARVEMMIDIVDDVIEGRNHLISRIRLPDGRELYRERIPHLMDFKRQLLHDREALRAQEEGRSPITTVPLVVSG